ncbi:endospore germination permease [Bacillus sp. AFS017336]|uniref:endospore germination permease n=1 Tax=Bacillus sp. AFS017336 TaxID=2033489 RepID=UPI000BEF5CBF|nr:endospore germination permease [Bacillus sp. AFS017336]PEK98137.1 hypothetical protein CN601_26155 [Bacillus sp. AFS017336]
MNNKTIQAVHVYFLLLLSSGFMLHVIIIPSLLTTSHRDSWLTAIASVVPFGIWTLLVFFLLKKLNNRNVFTLLDAVLPSPIKWIFFSLFILYFLCTAFITLKLTVSWAKANYAMEVPILFVIGLFSIICFFASYKGLRTISTTGFVALPFVVLFGFVVGVGNSPNKDYSLLFPIFQHGAHHFFKGFLYTCSGYFEILFIVFLVSYLTDKVKLKWMMLICFVLLMLLLGPLTGAITEFGWVEAEKLRNPAYEQWKLLKLGKNVTRLDFLAVFQWLSGAVIRVSLNVFLANKILSQNHQTKWIIPFLYVLLIIGAYVPWNTTSFFYFVHQIYMPVSLVFLCCAMGILLIVVLRKGENA